MRNERSFVPVMILIAPLAIGLATNTARSQRALDHNLQIGSGGVNSGTADSRIRDYREQSNLVSGVVGGGRQFRSELSDLRDHGQTIDEFGNIVNDMGQGGQFRQWRSGDLVAPGAFRDALGTDELFRFRARSQSVGYVNTFQGTDLGLQPIYSGSRPISVADVRDAVNARRDGESNRFWIHRRDAAAGDANIPFFVPATMLAQSGREGGDMGEMRLESGQFVELDATELRGLRMLPTNKNEATPDDRDASLAVDDETNADPADTAGDTMSPSNLKSPSLEIGTLIVATTDSRRAKASEDPEQYYQLIDQHAITIEQSIFGPDVAADQNADTGFYESLLQRIEAHHENVEAETSAPAGEDGELDGDAEATLEHRIQLMLQNPTALQMQTAEDDRRAAMKTALALPEEGVDDQDNTDLDGSLDELVNRLNAELPLVPTMSGEVDERINDLFLEAEAHMTEGRFFHAEQAYRQVLEYRPEHKLAGVGLLHAQLGAGMIRSAAFNVRKLFNQHPQLITVRYEARLLPDQDRLVWARNTIEKMLDSANLSEPAIVLAYLGYQTDNPMLVRYGLDVAQSRAPADPLLPLLRRIWIEEVEAAPAEDGPEMEEPPVVSGDTDVAETPTEAVEAPDDGQSSIEVTPAEPTGEADSSGGVSVEENTVPGANK